MATIGLSEAAKLTGTARSTLYRAIKAGRLSATIGPNSAVRIDPAELERVFPIRTERDNDAMSRGTTRNSTRPTDLVARVAELEARLNENDVRLADAQDQITDLRRRLDAEAEERRKLTLVLTDLRTVAPAPMRRWWPWRWS
jgi:excisionase family DNA binding protein